VGNNIIDFPPLASICSGCPWSRGCVVGARASVADAGAGPRAAPPLRRGQYVFRQGEALEWLYVLRAGSAKSCVDSDDGLEQVVAFHFPGDLLGFDAVADGRHQSSVVALETAAVCRIPFGSSERQASYQPRLWGDIMRAAARQIREQNTHALLLGQKSAHGRFASLLLDLAARYAARGCSRTEFNLSMPRQDIANYLSLAVETVSRLLADLQAAGAIRVNRRYVRILSQARLAALAGHGVQHAGEHQADSA
jgi:CRP/FNR family transcriptional regulator, anaerobic regulatory protein